MKDTRDVFRMMGCPWLFFIPVSPVVCGKNLANGYLCWAMWPLLAFLARVVNKSSNHCYLFTWNFFQLLCACFLLSLLRGWHRTIKCRVVTATHTECPPEMSLLHGEPQATEQCEWQLTPHYMYTLINLFIIIPPIFTKLLLCVTLFIFRPWPRRPCSVPPHRCPLGVLTVLQYGSVTCHPAFGRLWPCLHCCPAWAGSCAMMRMMNVWSTIASGVSGTAADVHGTVNTTSLNNDR